MNKWMKRLRRQDGLTLIELIVVVAIIGVLAWLITPRVLKALDNSKYNSAEGAASEILGALERYAAEYNYYPTDDAGGIPDGDTGWAALSDVVDLQVANPDKFLDNSTWKYNRSDEHEFCASFTAKNKDNTVFRIEKTGITPDGTACS